MLRRSVLTLKISSRRPRPWAKRQAPVPLALDGEENADDVEASIGGYVLEDWRLNPFAERDLLQTPAKSMGQASGTSTGTRE